MPQNKIDLWHYCHKTGTNTYSTGLFLYFFYNNRSTVREHFGNTAAHFDRIVAHTDNRISAHLRRMFGEQLIRMIA